MIEVTFSGFMRDRFLEHLAMEGYATGGSWLTNRYKVLQVMLYGYVGSDTYGVRLAKLCKLSSVYLYRDLAQVMLTAEIGNGSADKAKFDMIRKLPGYKSAKIIYESLCGDIKSLTVYNVSLDSDDKLSAKFSLNADTFKHAGDTLWARSNFHALYRYR
jgi:hypothetical protein